MSLAYWGSDQRRFVDADGRPVALLDDRDGRLWTVIKRDAQPVAAILHAADVEAESELIQAAAAAALTLENERLAAELAASAPSTDV